MDPSSKPKQKPGYRLEMLDNEFLLYHLSETTILYCNQTASLIWQLCDGRHTVKEIRILLSEAYPESAETVVADVNEVLRLFLEHKAIGLT